LNQSLIQFKGIWRRFEYLAEYHQTRIFSDYGHHPTAVAVTLAAARETYSGHRLVLCFQPHHRNRLKSLFLNFVPSFDESDLVILCEVYDVAGRDANQDQDISSQDLVDALIRHDADRGVKRTVEYAHDPKEAIEKTLSYLQPGDIVIVMGAGDIDRVLRKKLEV
jgi:UDP-N-acetylmuramate--alanine ligase